MEFEAPSVWPIASKHHFAQSGGARPSSGSPQSLATSPRLMPRPQRALDVVSDKASKNRWLSGSELKVRIQLPPAEGLRTHRFRRDYGIAAGA